MVPEEKKVHVGVCVKLEHLEIFRWLRFEHKYVIDDLVSQKQLDTGHFVQYRWDYEKNNDDNRDNRKVGLESAEVVIVSIIHKE